jgi:hypothetical protein
MCHFRHQVRQKLLAMYDFRDKGGHRLAAVSWLVAEALEL